VVVGTGLNFGAGFCFSGSYINTKTGSNYTLQVTDNGNMIAMTTASNLTVPGYLPIGFSCTGFQSGSGTVVVTGSNNAIINNRQGTSSSYAQWSTFSIINIATGSFLLMGDLR
jgi:hypothetical protein